MRRSVAALVATGALVFTGCSGSSSDSGTTTTAEGTTTTTEASAEPFVLGINLITIGESRGIHRNGDEIGSPCSTAGFTEPTDEFASFTPDAEVILQDEASETLATGSLGVGRVAAINPDKTEWLCKWEIDLGDVPERKFYAPTIGGKEMEIISHQRREGMEGGTVYLAIYDI